MALGLWQFPLALKFTFHFLTSHYSISLPAGPLHFVFLWFVLVSQIYVFSHLTYGWGFEILSPYHVVIANKDGTDCGRVEMWSYAYKPTLNRKWCEGRSGSMKGVLCPGHVSCHWILFHLLFCNWHGWLGRSWILVLSVITGEGNDVCKTTVLRNIMTTSFSPCIPFTAILMSLPVTYCAYVFKDVVSDYLSMFNFFFFRYSQPNAEFKIHQRDLEELLFSNELQSAGALRNVGYGPNNFLSNCCLG
jgi:hypothetical protein